MNYNRIQYLSQDQLQVSRRELQDQLHVSRSLLTDFKPLLVENKYSSKHLLNYKQQYYIPFMFTLNFVLFLPQLVSIRNLNGCVIAVVGV